jgi:hypothetical protein
MESLDCGFNGPPIKKVVAVAKISFGDVEVRTFEPLPRGKYLSKVSAAEFVPESKRSGEPCINWEFTVVGGEFDKRKAFQTTSLQKQSLWASQRMLLALGMTKAEVDGLEWDPDEPETVQNTLNDLMDKPCVIVMRQEKFEGEDRQRTSRVLAADNLQGVSNAEGASKAGF